MATTTTVEGTDDHGFELKRRPKWLWIALSLALVVVVVVGARLLFFGKTESANEIAGATNNSARLDGLAVSLIVLCENHASGAALRRIRQPLPGKRRSCWSQTEILGRAKFGA